jgi:hypothetical protein
MNRTRILSRSFAGIALLVVGIGMSACMSSSTDRPQPASVEELLERADRAFEGGRFAESVEIYKLAAASASSKRNGPAFVEAAAQVSSSMSLLGRAEDGQAWLVQAQNADDGLGSKPHARVLLASALHLRDTDQVASSLHAFDELFGFCMERGSWAQAMQAATLASVVAEGQARLEWARRNLEAARSSQKPAWVAAGWRGMGFAQEAAGEYANAVHSMREARKGSSQGGRARLRADWALAHMLRLSGKLAEADTILKAAVPAARRFHSKGYAPRDAEWLGRCFEEFAEVQASMGQKSNALAAMKSARKAYMLAEIQSLAPKKLRALDARVAEWKYQLDAARKP